MNRNVVVGGIGLIVVIGLVVGLATHFGPGPPTEPDEPERAGVGRPGSTSGDATVRDVATDEAEDDDPAPDDRIAGVVRLPDGSPAAEATVELLDRDGRLVSRATTDANGVYRLPRPRMPGPFELRVDHPGGVRTRRYLDRLPTDDDATPLDPLTLAPIGVVRGVVTQEGGHRVRGDVSLVFQGPDGARIAADVDRRGAYEVSLDRYGRWRAVAVETRRGAGATAEIETTVAVPEVELDLDLVRRPPIEITVFGPTGDRTAEATVTAGSEDDVWAETKTDAQGRAWLRVPPIEGVFLRASSAAGFARQPLGADATDPKARRVEIQLRPWRRLTVDVVDPDGGSPARAEVRVVPAEDGGAEARLLEPDPERPGRFVAEGLTDGALLVSARAPGFLSTTTKAAPTEEGEPVRVELARDPGEGSRSVDPTVVAGRVTWPDGRPVVGAEVAGADRHTVTDDDGRFALTGLPLHDGEPITIERLVVRPSGAPAHTEEGPFVGGRIDVTIILARRPAFSGRVLAVDGAVIPEFELVLEAVEGTRRRTFHSDDGTFLWPNLAPDTYRVTAWAGRAGSVPFTRVFVLGVDVLGVEIRIKPNGAIPGTVRTTALEPIAGARVTARNRFLAEERVVRGKTDSAGRFRIEQLEVGTWEVVAAAPGRVASDPLPVDVAAGQDRPLDLRLAPRDDEPLVRVFVRDRERGEGRAEITLVRLDLGGKDALVEPFVELIERGVYRVRNVDPGEYRVEVKVADRRGEARLTVRTGQSNRVSVTVR